MKEILMLLKEKKNYAFPPSVLAPPAGCRGALASWSQLLYASSKIMNNPETARQLHSHFVSPLGSARELLSQLVRQPNLLINEKPPIDIYGHVVWLSARVARISRTISVTLSELPTVLEASPSLSVDEKGEVVRRILAGTDGLSELAENMVQEVKQAIESARQNVSNRKKFTKDVKEQANKISFIIDKLQANNNKDLYSLHSTVSNTEYQVSQHFQQMTDLSNFAVLESVIDNLVLALKNMEKGWGSAAKNFQDLASNTDLASLADISFLQKTLNIQGASEEWNGFSDMTQKFISDSVVTS